MTSTDGSTVCSVVDWVSHSAELTFMERVNQVPKSSGSQPTLAPSEIVSSIFVKGTHGLHDDLTRGAASFKSDICFLPESGLSIMKHVRQENFILV